MLSNSKPVLYLDLDDTLLSWQSGSPRPARVAREFVLWALERFEVRWLTRWCPSGEMSDSHLNDLGKLLDLPPAAIRHIRGFEWNLEGSKLDGIAWLEHVVLQRPFLWVEDEKGVGERELRFLKDHGLLEVYHPVNVTRDPDSLRRLHAVLRRRLLEG
jgi:hypothetical protein